MRYSASKNSVTLKLGTGVVQGHWTWRRSIDNIRLSIDRPLYVSLYVVPFSSYLTLNNRDLEKITEAWRSFKLVPLEILGVSLTVYEIFSVKNWRDLENWVRGCSRSLKMAPFDRSHTTFYWSAIFNIALSCTLFELFDGVRGHSRSFELVPFESLDTVSYSPSIVSGFLHYFWDKATCFSKIVIFSYPFAFYAPVRGSPPPS